jgi:hypothetical protein
MHDLDRTLQEFEAGSNGFNSGEFEYEGEGEWEFDDASEFDGEWEGEGEWEAESEWEGGYDTEAVFDEVEEMELAASLLDSTDQQELDDFMGRLVRRAGRRIRRAVRSPVGRAIGGALRNVARKALPAVGAAVGGPVGARVASAAGRAFGLELEGLSPQDQEFEIARRLVRLGGAAVQQAVENPSGQSPAQVARNAVVAAARQHAPGLARDLASRRRRGRRQGEAPALPASGGRTTAGGTAQTSGRWIRRGNQIILMGV